MAASLARMLGQPVQIEAVIFIGEEAGLAVVAALDQMQRDAGQGQAGTAERDRLLRRIWG
ncbi:MAG: hypothetical protein AB7U30_13655 [Sulfuricellaceae bacterium]